MTDAEDEWIVINGMGGYVCAECGMPVESEPCEHAGHIDCRNLECRCDCHRIGRASTEQGVSALWDADQHTAGYVDRAGWVTDGRTVSQAAEERKSA